MTLNLFLWGMRIISLFSLLALGIVICFIDPRKAGIIGEALFYLSLFFFLSGIFTLFFAFVRRKFSDSDKDHFLSINFRQGLLAAVLVIILLFFQSKRILVWWDGLLILAGILLVEFYFLSKNYITKN